MDPLAWKIPLAVLIAVFVISILVSGYRVIVKCEKQKSPPQEAQSILIPRVVEIRQGKNIIIENNVFYAEDEATYEQVDE